MGNSSISLMAKMGVYEKNVTWRMSESKTETAFLIKQLKQTKTERQWGPDGKIITHNGILNYDFVTSPHVSSIPSHA